MASLVESVPASALRSPGRRWPDGSFRLLAILAAATILALIVLVGALTVAGSSACNARYRYLKHGPYFTGTPPGTYTVTITAQTSDGVTASLQSQTLTLVVN